MVRNLLTGPNPVTDVVQVIKQLVARGVGRLEALEVLIAMASHPERAWSHAALCDGASYRARVVAEGLAALEQAGIAVRAAGAGEHYHLHGEVDRAQMRALAAAYKRDRLHVTNTFFACNLDSLRDLSEGRKPRG